MSHEPGLRFWLAHVEIEGGLIEDRGEAAVVLLPPPLARADGLPEELIVTSDPEVAHEDGATLMIAGHPALERAAAAVLARGDVGHRYLPWPSGERPRASALQERARAQIDIDHGRIDVAGEPAACYRPLTRVAAMVSYAASLTHRFHEREEVWVDALTGEEVTERLRVAIERRVGEDDGPVVGARILEADQQGALRSAHRLLVSRAAARSRALAAQTRGTKEAELARTDAYYRAALASIERRQAAASCAAGAAAPERARLLAAQAQATREEHARRRHEITEQYRPRREIQPFRLHLMCVPAYQLAVDIRRGARRYPFTLCWLPLIGEFAAPCCPACGVVGPLVAGRERLGCQACLSSQSEPDVAPPRPAAAVGVLEAGAGVEHDRAPGTPVLDGPRAARHTAPGPPVLDGPGARGRAGGPPAGRDGRSAAANATATADAGGRRPAPPPAARKRQREQQARERRAQTQRGERAGGRLAMSYWQAISSGERCPRAKLVMHSPLSVLHRLYGNEGPLLILGVARGVIPAGVSAATGHPVSCGELQAVSGDIEAGGRDHPYVLWWGNVDGRPALAELTPFAHSSRPARGQRGVDLPSPMIGLDPVAALLWRTELSGYGMPVAVRALAAWWRLQELCDDATAPGVLAAAVATAVATGSGTGRGAAAVAQLYGVERPAVARVTRTLAAPLRLVRARGW